MYTQLRKRGISVVEVAIGVSIAALAITFTAHAITRFASSGRESAERVQAALLAEEGVELMRYLRDDSWTNLESMTNGTAYYLTVSTTTISTSTTPSLIEGKYTRTITTSAVYRATAGKDIVASTSGVAKSVDSHTKLVTVDVTWGTPVSTVSLATYLTNI